MVESIDGKGECAPRTENTAAYLAFAERLMRAGLVDAWVDGKPRFSAEPVFVLRREWSTMVHAVEALAMAWNEGCRLCERDPSLLDEALALTPVQKKMWTASKPLWHGFARADVFRTIDGRIQICEINADTPTGQPEAIALSAAAQESHPECVDPNTRLAARMIKLVEHMAAAGTDSVSVGPIRLLTIGIVYPTEMTEDLALVRMWKSWLESRGHRVVLGSPFNLSRAHDENNHADKRPRLLSVACDVIVRHYKADWWSERSPLLSTDPPFRARDAEPLTGPLDTLLLAQGQGQCVIVNPLGSVVAQNKRFMALLWEHRARLSPAAQEAIASYLPETHRFDALDRKRLESIRGRERELWVLKSDYGCEGDEVFLGALMTQAAWEQIIDQALPYAHRWVVQRRFVPVTNARGESINHGLYLVAGAVSGTYARISVDGGPTNAAALSAPTLIEP